MEPTMTIILKDGKPSFTVPYSQKNLEQYQRSLGDTIKDVIFNNVQNAPVINNLNQPPAVPAPIETAEIVQAINGLSDVVADLTVVLRGIADVSKDFNKFQTGQKKLQDSEK